MSQGIVSLPWHAGAPPVPPEVALLVEDPELAAVTLLVAVEEAEEVAPPVPVLVPVPDPPAPSVNSSNPRIAAHPERAVPASASPIHVAVIFIAAHYQTSAVFGPDER